MNLPASIAPTRPFSPFQRGSRALTLVALSAVLAACGSSVKLDEVPVSDRAGAPVQAPQGGGAGGAGAGVGDRAVSQVKADDFSAGQPPANLSRLVYFDFDSFAIRSEFTPVLEGHAKFLNADRKRRVNLEGHTDERGGREYNLALGQKRAEAVRRSLGLLGVADGQMEAVSFGKEKPAAQGSTEEAWARNRRVELTYR
jgi:peptidoglycan-associated lipoprotein